MKRYIRVAAESEPPESKTPKRIVLYVEDDASNRRVSQVWLRKDYELSLAQSDIEACRYVRDCHSQIYCVLMDIQLQGSKLNGIELTRLFRGKSVSRDLPGYALGLPTLGVPIFFLTAYGADFSDGELEDAGGNRIIDKPIDFVQLQLALTQAHLINVRCKFMRM